MSTHSSFDIVIVVSLNWLCKAHSLSVSVWDSEKKLDLKANETATTDLMRGFRSESLRMNQNSSLQSLIETFSKQIEYYDSNLKFWSRIRSSPWIKWGFISKQSFSFSSLDGPHRPWLDRWVVGRWLFWFKVLSNSLLSEWLPGIGEKLTLFPVSFFLS